MAFNKTIFHTKVLGLFTITEFEKAEQVYFQMWPLNQGYITKWREQQNYFSGKRNYP